MTDYHSQIETEAARLAALAGDLSVPVPTCPGWTIAELITHVGQTHRWTVHMLRNRVQERVWSRQVPSGLAEGRSGDAAWLAAGAAELLEVLRETDPSMEVWTWGPDKRASWWPRRMLFELVVHRVDAELALGVDPEIPAGTAIDGIEEFLHNLPSAAWVTKSLTELGVEGPRSTSTRATPTANGPSRRAPPGRSSGRAGTPRATSPCRGR
ncbi:maleylpyruvate isomerase family mycothiol-dependent enzyme [Nonomuraea thailandensis]